MLMWFFNLSKRMAWSLVSWAALKSCSTRREMKIKQLFRDICQVAWTFYANVNLVLIYLLPNTTRSSHCYFVCTHILMCFSGYGDPLWSLLFAYFFIKASFNFHKSPLTFTFMHLADPNRLALHLKHFFFLKDQWVLNLIIRIFWGAFVSRSFTFTVPQRRNDLHLTSSEERLFILSVNQHWIALHYMFGSFHSSICYTVIKITLQHYKHQNFILIY